MGDLSTRRACRRSNHRPVRTPISAVGGVAGTGILLVGLVTAPPPDIAGASTQVRAVQFTAVAHPALPSAPPVARIVGGQGAAVSVSRPIIDSGTGTFISGVQVPSGVATVPRVAESPVGSGSNGKAGLLSVAAADAADDLYWQYWIEDLGSSILAIPGILLIGVPFIGLLAVGVVVGTALSLYAQVASVLGLPSRFATANLAASPKVEAFAEKAVDPPPSTDAGAATLGAAGKPEIADRSRPPSEKIGVPVLRNVTERIREAVFGDRDAPDTAVGAVEAGVEQTVSDSEDALKRPVATRHLFVRSAGSDEGSMTRRPRPTPVKDALGEAGTQLKKAVNQLSDRAKSAVKKAVRKSPAGHAANPQ